jgi:hypothetical protein
VARWSLAIIRDSPRQRGAPTWTKVGPDIRRAPAPCNGKSSSFSAVLASSRGCSCRKPCSFPVSGLGTVAEPRSCFVVWQGALARRAHASPSASRHWYGTRGNGVPLINNERPKCEACARRVGRGDRTKGGNRRRLPGRSAPSVALCHHEKTPKPAGPSCSIRRSMALGMMALFEDFSAERVSYS